MKSKRLSAGLTQTELADLLGNVHPQFVSNWERGNCAPPSHCLPNLISILRIKKADLVDVMVEDSRIEIEKRVFAKAQGRTKTSSKSKVAKEA